MNIAEGCGRYTRRDTASFFQIAMGSACEVEYGLFLAYSLKLLGAAEYQDMEGAVRSVKRMLAKLIASMRNGRYRQPTTDN
jgi:four helix bundle protein